MVFLLGKIKKAVQQSSGFLLVFFHYMLWSWEQRIILLPQAVVLQK